MFAQQMSIACPFQGRHKTSFGQKLLGPHHPFMPS